MKNSQGDSMKKLFILIIAMVVLFLPTKSQADNWVQSGNYNYTNITGTATTLIKTGQTFLHTVTINKPVASSVILLSDNVSGGAQVPIATITLPGTLLSQGPYTAIYDIQTVNGLTVYTTSAASDITIASK